MSKGRAIWQGTLPMTELQQLTAAMRDGEHWRAALARLPLPEMRRKPYWFEDLTKARFYLDLPVGRRGAALDVGAGSGIISFGLASQFERVVALEHQESWAEFMRLRFAQDNATNIEVVNASAVPLPFEDATFDLVVVNGVLEWIPEATPASQSPRDSQREFLRDVRRVLRPGGTLAVAIENRFFLDNFFGTSPHGEPPFAAVLPRPISEWLSQRANARPYRTWIYGAPGYRALLRDAGFDRVEVKAVLPSYHQPREVVPLSDRVAIRRYFTPRNPLKRLVLDVASRIGLLGRMVHSFYLVAT